MRPFSVLAAVLVTAVSLSFGMAAPPAPQDPLKVPPAPQAEAAPAIVAAPALERAAAVPAVSQPIAVTVHKPVICDGPVCTVPTVTSGHCHPCRTACRKPLQVLQPAMQRVRCVLHNLGGRFRRCR